MKKTKVHKILIIDYRDRRSLIKSEIEKVSQDSFNVEDIKYFLDESDRVEISNGYNFETIKPIFESKLQNHGDILLVMFHLNQGGKFDFVRFMTEEKKIPLVGYTGEWQKEEKNDLYYQFPYALYADDISNMNIESFFTSWEKDIFSKDTLKNHWDKLKNE